METVRTVASPKPTPEVAFSISPTAGAYSYTVGVTVYNPTNAELVDIDTSITFTASVSFPDPTHYATSYEWDFGDGAKGYGSPTTHTYLAANPHVQAVLTVVDNQGNRWRARKQIYLQ